MHLRPFFTAEGRLLPLQHIALESNGILRVFIKLGFCCAAAEVVPDMDVSSYLSAHGDKRLHDNGSVILDIAEGLADLAPWSAPFARNHAVAFSCVEMAQKAASSADGIGNARLLDIHMKCI